MPLDVEKELAALKGMTTSKLCDRYLALFGEPVRTRHREYLVRKIIWRLQALEEGDLSERARQRAESLAQEADVRLMPPRGTESGRDAYRSSRSPAAMAPGTALTRLYKGRTLRVVALEDGFEYDGQRFKSLSAVAKAITGSHLSGIRFFKAGGGAA